MKSRKEIIDRFDDLKSLQDGWNGEGAKASVGWVFDKARDVTFILMSRGFPPPYGIWPRDDGGVNVEWEDETINPELNFLGIGGKMWGFVYFYDDTSFDRVVADFESSLDESPLRLANKASFLWSNLRIFND